MFERGDLLLIPFPFSDLSATKKRPVLVLTRPQTDHGIALAATDLVQGSLPLASWIRTDRIVTLNASLVVKGFGRAAERIITAALTRLCAYVEQGGPAAQSSSSS